jgi:hypothetical protein
MSAPASTPIHAGAKSARHKGTYAEYAAAPASTVRRGNRQRDLYSIPILFRVFHRCAFRLLGNTADAGCGAG